MTEFGDNGKCNEEIITVVFFTFSLMKFASDKNIFISAWFVTKGSIDLNQISVRSLQTMPINQLPQILDEAPGAVLYLDVKRNGIL